MLNDLLIEILNDLLIEILRGAAVQILADLDRPLSPETICLWCDCIRLTEWV